MNINKHPFWKACVGSQLNFILIEPPDSQLKSLHVSIYTVSPKTYEIRIFTSDGQCSSSVHYEKEAISLIKKNWMKYYANKTRVEFIEFHQFDMSTLFLDSPRSETASPRSPKSKTTSPRSPRSPKPETTSPRSPPSPKPETASPRTPRSETTSPRSPSPRTSSNETDSWFKKRLSLPLKFRSKKDDTNELSILESQTKSKGVEPIVSDVMSKSPVSPTSPTLKRWFSSSSESRESRSNSPSPKFLDLSPNQRLRKSTSTLSSESVFESPRVTEIKNSFV